jgi:hypothetical protein
MLPTKFRFIWPSFRPDPLTNMAATGNSCFWLADLKNCSPLKPLGQMNRNLVGSIYGRSPVKIAHFVSIRLQTYHRCFFPSFGSLGKAVSEETIFRNRPIRNNNCLWRPCLLMDQDEMSNLYRGPSIDVSYQISVHLGKRFQRRRFILVSDWLIFFNLLWNRVAKWTETW